MKFRIPGTGIDAEVVSDEETEKAALVICVRVEDMPEGEFLDDILTVCGVCEEPIRHRPHVPKTPPKVCMQCAMEIMDQAP